MELAEELSKLSLYLVFFETVWNKFSEFSEQVRHIQEKLEEFMEQLLKEKS